MAGQELADTIAGFALFADLTTPQREQVVDVFSEQWFGDGEKILRQGLSGSGLYVVLDGAAAIRNAAGGRLLRRDLLPPG